MDSSRFDQLARRLGERHSRRRSLAILASAAAVVAIPMNRASAGSPCALICPANTEFFDQTGTCSQTVQFNDPTVPGGCAGQTFDVSCSPASGQAFALGQTTVTCTSTDPALTCQFTVFGFDGNEIFATCPADINLEASGPTSVAYDPVMIGTACSPETAPANCTFESGAIFPLGTTTVTCTVPQGAGGPPQGSCSFNVTLAPAVATDTPTVTSTAEPVDPTATPTEPPATPTEPPATTEPTTIPGQPTATDAPATEAPATESPATVAPTSIPNYPTATAGPVTGLPNTGTGEGGSAGDKLLPIAVVGAGAALLVRLGLRPGTKSSIKESE